MDISPGAYDDVDRGVSTFSRIVTLLKASGWLSHSIDDRSRAVTLRSSAYRGSLGRPRRAWSNWQVCAGRSEIGKSADAPLYPRWKLAPL